MAFPAHRCAAAALASALAVIAAANPASAQETASRPRLEPLLDLDYSARAIAWDEKERFSTLAKALLSAGVRIEWLKGWRISALVGLNMSDWSGLIFRSLPFSVEDQAGSRAGLSAGAGLENFIARLGSWDFKVEGRFMVSLGFKKTLPLSGLNEAGEVDMQGSWMHLRAGPVVTYRGFEGFSPFLGASFDRIWGSVTMDESVGDLQGSEKKPVSGRGWAALSGGILWEPGSAFGLGWEVSVYPYPKKGGSPGFDFGMSLKAFFPF
ncbi:MAG: hypothetical protein FJY82_03630 [Candidatus Aminicenantes bacterium]|nr:hypothetical protein [Candidatus Aminicenantes bacterium]